MVVGYIGLILSFVTLWALARNRRRANDPLAETHIWIIAYFALSLALFYHGPQILGALFSESPVRNILNLRFQGGLLVLAMAAVVEAAIVVHTSDAYWRMLLPSLFVFGISPVLLYLVGAGIINLAWTTIFGGAQSALLMVTALFAGLEQGIARTRDLDDEKDRRALLDLIRQEMNGLLRMAFTAFLGLGASLGVSMTILFRDGETAWGNPTLLSLSFTMVLGFIAVCLGTMIWVIKPYVRLIGEVRYYSSPLRLRGDKQFETVARKLSSLEADRLTNEWSRRAER